MNMWQIIFGLLFLSFAEAQLHLVTNDRPEIYKLINKVEVSDLEMKTKSETSYSFEMFLKFSSVWREGNEQVLQIHFGKPKIFVPSKSKQENVTHPLNQIPDRPFYIIVSEKEPLKIVAPTGVDQAFLNLQRSIASLLMVRWDEIDVSEVDVSGRCHSFYHLEPPSRIEKIKTECSGWEQKTAKRSGKSSGILRNSKQIIRSFVRNDGLLLLAESRETHSIFLAAKPDVGSLITSDLSLSYMTSTEDQVKQMPIKSLEEMYGHILDSWKVFDIEASLEDTLGETKSFSLKESISKMVSDLQDNLVGDPRMAVSFLELLPLAKSSKKQEFIYILYIKKLQNHLVDLMGAVQSLEAFEAIHEVFDINNKKHSDLLERFYQDLAVGTQPDRKIIEKIFEYLKNPASLKINEKLLDTLTQTLAAMVKHSGFEENNWLAEDVREFLLKSLNTCKDVNCKTSFIRALQNLQDPLTLPKLLHIALEDEARASVAALQAIQSFPKIYLLDNYWEKFASIFYEIGKKYDSSARTIAFDIMIAMMEPCAESVGEFLDYLLLNDTHYELKTFVIEKLKMLSEETPSFHKLLRDSLKERPYINNYQVMGQKGLTTVLRRQLSEPPFFKESLYSTQEVSDGLLKRGSVELISSSNNKETTSFKLGLFTRGLGSIAEKTAADGENERFFTAGMEISVEGVALRPLVFFPSKTQLITYIWKGKASSLTPAYQATILTEDHEESIILSSGATLFYRISGAKSIDLSGKFSLSLWNKKGNMEIIQTSGTAFVGHVVVGMSYAKIEQKFSVTYDPKISLQADVDYSGKFELCFQLQRPEMVLNHSSSFSVFLEPRNSPVSEATYKIDRMSPGKSFALSRKNNDMCKLLFN